MSNVEFHDFLLALWLLDYILIEEGQIRVENMNKRLRFLLSVRNIGQSLGDIAAVVTYNMIGSLPQQKTKVQTI